MPATATTTSKDNESPRVKFTRLAEGRVTKVLVGIGLVEQLANPQRYEYSEGDIAVIESALTGAVEKSIAALRAGKVQTAHFALATTSEDE